MSELEHQPIRMSLVLQRHFNSSNIYVLEKGYNHKPIFVGAPEVAKHRFNIIINKLVETKKWIRKGLLDHGTMLQVDFEWVGNFSDLFNPTRV